jgi:hypothetical protein
MREVYYLKFDLTELKAIYLAVARNLANLYTYHSPFDKGISHVCRMHLYLKNTRGNTDYHFNMESHVKYFVRKESRRRSQ